MKRPPKNHPTATPNSNATHPCQSWPGLFFKQRADLSFEWAAPEMEKFMGATSKPMRFTPERFWAIVHPADVVMLQKQIELCQQSGQWVSHDYRVCHPNTGQVSYVSESRRALLDKSGTVFGYEGFWVDVTRQTLAERRLLLAAWKETLADLTPGLAHDFNNVLTGILSMSETCLAQLSMEHEFHESLSLIKQKAEEASQLILRITRLSQAKTGSCDYQDVNAIVTETVEILGKVVCKRIELSSSSTLGAEPLPVYVDGVEFRRVLLSLALSAVNTIPGHGKLHFQSSRYDVPPVLTQLQGIFPRCPVIGLSVSAAGTGSTAKRANATFYPDASPETSIDPPDLARHSARVFAEESSGAISLESAQPDQTTFHLWLPQANFAEA